MTKDQFAEHMRAMGFNVKVSTRKHVTMWRNCEDVSKQDVFDYTTFQDRMTISGVVINKRKDDDSYNTMTVYFN